MTSSGDTSFVSRVERNVEKYSSPKESSFQGENAMVNQSRAVDNLVVNMKNIKMLKKFIKKVGPRIEGQELVDILVMSL